MNEIKKAILETLCFHRAWNYAPTLPELFVTLQTPERSNEPSWLTALEELKGENLIKISRGRVGLSDGFDDIAAETERRDPLQAAKRRRAMYYARWLIILGGVRFVALSNTTALGNARRDGDLDFFIVVKKGTLWMTRLLSAGLFKLLGLLPRKNHERDAACLSYFVTDDALDLSSHMLEPDDPYFRYWFLSLLPLFDDGVSAELWRSNRKIIAQHANARIWIVPPDLRLQAARQGIRNKEQILPAAGYRLPSIFCRLFEQPARAFQLRWFPRGIKELMNRDTRVLVSDRVLKLHVNDGRERYREAYLASRAKIFV